MLDLHACGTCKYFRTNVLCLGQQQLTIQSTTVSPCPRFRKCMRFLVASHHFSNNVTIFECCFEETKGALLSMRAFYRTRRIESSDTNLWTYLKAVDLYRQDSQMMRGIWSYTSLKHAKGINKKDASIECYKDGNSAPDEHLVGLVYR